MQSRNSSAPPGAGRAHPPFSCYRLAGGQRQNRRCRDCGGVLRPYGDTGKLACERCARVVETFGQKLRA